MPTESVTPTFGIVTPYIIRAYKGEAIAAKDFQPLSGFMQTQVTYDTFEGMLIRSFVKRVPAPLWSAMVGYARQHRMVPRTADAAAAVAKLGSLRAAKAANGASPDGCEPIEEGTAIAEEATLEAAAKMVDLGAALDECGGEGRAVDASGFVILPESHREAWAVLAVRLSEDKARLILQQDVGLLWLLTRAVSGQLLLGFFIGVVRTAAVMAQVVVLWTLVRLANRDEGIGEWHVGLRCLISLVLPLGALVQSFGQHNTFHITNNAAIMARSIVLALVYEKLRVMTPLYIGSAVARSKATGAEKKDGADNNVVAPPTGDVHVTSDESFARGVTDVANTNPVSTGLMINLISSDANTILEAALMLPLGLTSLLDLTACLIWVGILAGWATVILLCAMFAVFLFQVYCGYRVSANKLAVARVCDQRLRALTEFLTGIQVVKFYAWEENVRRMIKALRGVEARLLVQGNSWKLIGLTSTFCAPGIFYLCLFGVRTTYASDMDPITTFTIMALLATNVNRTFQVLPRTLTVVGTTAASLKRIRGFLLKDITTGLPKASSSTPAHGDDDGEMRPAPSPTVSGGLYIRGNYGWPGFALRGVDLRCRPGTMTVVMGTVGSGKSTLLQAAMGMCAALSADCRVELPGGDASMGTSSSPLFDTSAEVNLRKAPRIAYVPQEAFIAEATVRDNITFGLPYDEGRYRRVIKACSLVTDLRQWGGDLVEVSGNTLSGGQRQRLSLARACYSDAAVYIVDDPISAVDASVGRHLLTKCFRGFLADKTILLATHHPAPARFADQVVLLKNGRPPLVKHAKEVSPQLVAALTGDAGEDGEADPLQLDGDAGPISSPDADVGFDEDDAALDATLDELLGKARALKVVEAEAVGSVPISVYFSYCRGGGLALMVLTLSFFVLSQGIRSGGDWWFSAWTANDFPELTNEQYLWIYACIVGVLIIASTIRTIAFGIFTVRASSSLHDRMFEAVIASPLYFFEQVSLGRIMNRFSKDLDYCDDLLPRVLFDLCQMIFLVCGALAMQIYSVPWFAIAIPIAFAAFVVLLTVYMPASRYVKRIESTSRSPSMNTFQHVMSGLTTLRMYDRMVDYRRMYFDYCDVTINAMLHSSCMQRWIAVRMDYISAMWSLCAALLCAGLMFEMGPSIVGLCLSQSVFLAGLFQFAVRMATETEMMMTSVERLDEYGHLPAEENNGTRKDAVALLADKAAGRVVNAEALPDQWPHGCDIAVQGLTVAHYSNPGVNVLKNLHFTIRAGQRVAVVGRTGAGKSTLLSAFFRTLFVPDGSISIGGVKTTDVDVFALRSKLGVIPQVPTLFHGTFRYNLDPFGQFDDAAMTEALQKVRLQQYVADRQGLDTPVGEGGGNLSVGQRQLLCAARVLLTGASILFMDEATANIDEETDAQIQEIMREEAARRQMTIVTIAHRLNTVLDYDLVLVLSQGRLVEVGNPMGLVEAGVHTDVMGGPASLGGLSDKEFTTDVQLPEEVCQFARMVQAMNEAHGE